MVVLPGDVIDEQVHMEVPGKEGDLEEEGANGRVGADSSSLSPAFFHGVVDSREDVSERGHLQAE